MTEMIMIGKRFFLCVLFLFLTGCSPDVPVEDTPVEIGKKTNSLNNYEFAYGNFSNFISDIVDVQEGTYVIGTYSDKERTGMSIAVDYVVNDQKRDTGYRDHFDGLVPLRGINHHGNTLYLFFSKENEPEEKTELVVFEKGTVVYQNNAIANCNSNGEIVKRVFSDSEAFEFVQSGDNLMVEVRAPWQEQYRCKKSLSFKLESTSRIEVFDEDDNASLSFYQLVENAIRVYRLDLNSLKISSPFTLPFPDILSFPPRRTFKEGKNYVFLFSVTPKINQAFLLYPAKYYKKSLNKPDNHIENDVSMFSYLGDYLLALDDDYLFVLVIDQSGNIKRKKTVLLNGLYSFRSACVSNEVLSIFESEGGFEGHPRMRDKYFVQSIGFEKNDFNYDFTYELKKLGPSEGIQGIKCKSANELLLIGASLSKCQLDTLRQNSFCNKDFIKTKTLY